jgi:hypothetical protein
MNNQKCVKQQSNNEFARPYINRQVYNKSYSANMALRKGTLFPELYLVESNHYNDWLYQNPKNRVK